MKTLDIVLCIPLLFGLYRGFKKGFIVEFFTIISLFIAVIGAFQLLQSGIDFLTARMDSYDAFIPYLAFILLFVGILLLVNLVGRILKKVIDMTLFGSLDQLLGGIVGILKWAFAVSIILWLSAVAGIEFPENITESTFIYPFLVNFAPGAIKALSPLLPFAGELFDQIKTLLNGKEAFVV